MKQIFLAICAITTTLASSVQAQEKTSEVPDAIDHPVISRYVGSVLQNVATSNFGELRIPASGGTYVKDKLVFEKFQRVSGKISAYFYVGPKERSAVEVFRNYQLALAKTQFDVMYQCELQDCYDALIVSYRSESIEPLKWIGSRINPNNSSSRDIRFLSAKGSRGGADVFLEVFVAEPDSVWQSPVTVLLVVEAKALDVGQVVVDSAALREGLSNHGKVILSGLYFESGKTEVKPESKPQLEAMVQLLKAELALKVFIVGHTDNQGSIEFNLNLSRRRAESVVQHLIKDYQIAPGRLEARGVANFSPVAPSSDEAGRAKNRRVELVAR
jgi:OmpA-OmpF porin, OOP family